MGVGIELISGAVTAPYTSQAVGCSRAKQIQLTVSGSGSGSLQVWLGSGTPQESEWVQVLAFTGTSVLKWNGVADAVRIKVTAGSISHAVLALIEGGSPLPLTDADAQNAINAALGGVVLPDGYSPIRVAYDAGSNTFYGVDPASVLRPLTPATGAISAKDYGAVGNGVTDDTAALRVAVSAASSLNKVLVLEGGTYVVSDAITVPQYAQVEGRSKAKIKTSGSGFAALVLQGDNIIRGLEFDLTSQALVGPSYGIYAKGRSRINVYNCYLHDGLWGMWFDTCQNVIVADCEGAYFTQWPVYCVNCEGIWYDRNHMHHNTLDGLKIATVLPSVGPPAVLPSENNVVFVTNNHSHHNSRDGFDIATGGATRLQISGNIFYENQLQGIDWKVTYTVGYEGYKFLHWSIHSNVLKDNWEQAINIQADGSAANAYIADGQVYGNMCVKVFVADGDHPSDASGSVIRISNGSYINVHNNTIRAGDFVAQSFRIINSDHVSIHHNDIQGGIIGVRLESQSGLSCTQNDVWQNDMRPKQNGVYMGEAPVTANRVYQNHIEPQTDAYITLETGGASGNVLVGNWSGFFAGQGISPAAPYVAPTGRGVIGQIILNSNMIQGQPFGWVAGTTSGSALWTPFGQVGYRQISGAGVAPSGTPCWPGEMIYNLTDKKWYMAKDTPAGAGSWFAL